MKINLIFQIKKNISRGFTLVEMIVVLGLFSFIMTLATGVLYTTQSINVKLQASQAVIDNVNVSVETMARDIRYGSDFSCLKYIPDTTVDTSYLVRRNCEYADSSDIHGGVALSFKPIDAATTTDRVIYYASTTINGSYVIKKDEYYYGKATSSYQITSDDVMIKSLVFFVSGASSTAPLVDGGGDPILGTNDFIQPLIIFSLSGETVPTKSGATTTPFTIGTSISSRVMDN